MTFFECKSECKSESDLLNECRFLVFILENRVAFMNGIVWNILCIVSIFSHFYSGILTYQLSTPSLLINHKSKFNEQGHFEALPKHIAAVFFSLSILRCIRWVRTLLLFRSFLFILLIVDDRKRDATQTDCWVWVRERWDWTTNKKTKTKSLASIDNGSSTLHTTEATIYFLLMNFALFLDCLIQNKKINYNNNNHKGDHHSNEWFFFCSHSVFCFWNSFWQIEHQTFDCFSTLSVSYIKEQRRLIIFGFKRWSGI